MDLKDKTIQKKWWKSFRYAFQGINYVILHERNMKIHIVVGLAVLIMSFYFRISSEEWLIILLTIGGMLCVETINTAIEKTVDMITVDYHPLAKLAKDIAAGASLIFAVVSVIIGVIIFLPYIQHIFK